jgi:hypothetical protein
MMKRWIGTGFVRFLALTACATLSPLANAQWNKAQFSGLLMNPACFSPKDSNRDDFGLQINGPADQSERAWLPSVLGRVAFLAGGNANRLIGNVRVNIHQGGKSFGSPCASYTSSANTIELVTKCRPGANAQSAASHFAHELGHIVGLRGYYNSYQSAMRTPCRVTHYCTANHNHNPRNEEFAEVFATYLHSPNYLRNACPEQFEWMKKNVFPNGPDPGKTCTGNPNPNFSAPDYEDEADIGPRPLSKLGSVNSQMNQFTPLMQQLMQMMAQRQQAGAPPQAPVPIVPAPIQQNPVQPQSTPVVPANPWPEGAH